VLYFLVWIFSLSIIVLRFLIMLLSVLVVLPFFYFPFPLVSYIHIRSVISILSVQSSSIKYIHIVVQPFPLSISRTLSSFHTEPLYSLNITSPFFLPAAPSNLCSSTFCFYVFNYCSTSCKKNYTFFSLFHWTYCLKVCSCYSMYQSFIPFCRLIILQYMYIPHFVYPFFSQ
jgi:hypothetical protein